jgi:hypothetical protein
MNQIEMIGMVKSHETKVSNPIMHRMDGPKYRKGTIDSSWKSDFNVLKIIQHVANGDALAASICTPVEPTLPQMSNALENRSRLDRYISLSFPHSYVCKVVMLCLHALNDRMQHISLRQSRG